MGGQRAVEHLLGGLRHADRTLSDSGDTTHARRRYSECATGSTESAPARRGGSTAHTGPASRGAGAGR